MGLIAGYYRGAADVGQDVREDRQARALGIVAEVTWGVEGARAYNARGLDADRDRVAIGGSDCLRRSRLTRSSIRRRMSGRSRYASARAAR